MSFKKHTLPALATGLLASVALQPHAAAQSADALIDKLVEKGVLTSKEATDLREEADKSFTTAYSVKSGMPTWVNALKLNGDFRGRYDGVFSDNPAFVDRNRFRYRLRFGVTAELQNNFEVGFRLSSSEPTTVSVAATNGPQGGIVNGSGGDPISANQSLTDNASRKWVWMDLAYAKWTPVRSADWTGSLTIGKMENPFTFVTDMIWDNDYNPEGAAFQLTHFVADKQALVLNGGAFVLDELANSSADPYLLGGQLFLNSTWSPKLSTSLGGGVFNVSHDGSLVNGAVPNVNRGNTRIAGGALAYGFTTVNAQASATYTLSEFPLYTGAFPIRIGGEYDQNLDAPSSADNDAWTAGVTFGKAGKKGTYALSYYYRHLGANACWEEFSDSDFGAYYGGTYPNSSLAAGYGAGTNVKGHIAMVQYSPYDFLTLSLKGYLTEAVNPFPVTTDTQMTRVQADAVFKF